MSPHALPAVLVCTVLACAAPPRTTVPCEVLVPVLDTKQSAVTATAPDGRSYPVFRVAPATKRVGRVRNELDTSFAQQVLKLDRYARNLLIARRAGARAPMDEALTAPSPALRDQPQL